MENQLKGFRLPHRLPFGGEISEPDHPPLLNGGADGLKFRGQAGFVPGGKINPEMAAPGHQAARTRREFFHQPGIPPGAADAVQAAEPRQDGLHLPRGQDRPVHPVTLQNRDAPAGAPGGAEGNPRQTQGLDVPLDGPAGHLEPLGQLRRCDPLLLEQKGKNPDQTFGFHWDTPLSALRAIVWGHYTTGTRQLSVLFG